MTPGTIARDGGSVLRRAIAFACAAAASIVALAIIDGVSRQLLRRPLGLALGFHSAPSDTHVLGAAAIAVTVLVLAWAGRRVDRLVVLALVVGCLAGLAGQRALGARLGSDGLRYFAFARSIAFDHDVNLMNDYVAIGLGEDRELLTPTRTGYAQSPFSVGPALAWLPAIAVAHGAARALKAAGVAVATDGTSFPYRQAACIASLFYALLGFWFCFRLASLFAGRASAAMATSVMATGSFMVWYS